MRKVLIYGFGGIGKRHYESIVKKYLDIFIYVFDKDKETYKYLTDRDRTKCISDSREIKDLDIDLAILSIINKGKASIVEDLFENNKIKNLIIEKPLCQSLAELDLINSLAISKNIFVNFPYRYYPFWIEVKKLAKNRNFRIEVEGKSWGLGCNLWHFLDLHFFIFNEKIIEVDWREFSWIDSKREGFKEIYGKAAVKFETRRLILSQQNSHKSDSIIRLINEEDEKVLMEIEDFKITKNKLFKFKNVDIEIFQSELTSKYIHDIKSGNCLLPQVNHIHYNTASMMNSIILSSDLKLLKPKKNILIPIS